MEMGKTAKMNDNRLFQSNRWTKRITNWCPYSDKRSRKGPDTRWRDDIEKYARKKHSKEQLRIGSCGGNLKRPMFNSGLTRTDDDDNDDCFSRLSSFQVFRISYPY